MDCPGRALRPRARAGPPVEGPEPGIEGRKYEHQGVGLEEGEPDGDESEQGSARAEPCQTLAPVRHRHGDDRPPDDEPDQDESADSTKTPKTGRDSRNSVYGGGAGLARGRIRASAPVQTGGPRGPDARGGPPERGLQARMGGHDAARGRQIDDAERGGPPPGRARAVRSARSPLDRRKNSLSGVRNACPRSGRGSSRAPPWPRPNCRGARRSASCRALTVGGHGECPDSPPARKRPCSACANGTPRSLSCAGSDGEERT